MSGRRQHGQKLTYYDLGKTPFFAAQGDQRFSYCLYVPEDYDESGTARYSLVVVVHGTGRTAETYRNLFADFAQEHQAIVLAPLFPAGIVEPGDLGNYRRIKFHDIRFDHVLLGMVGEVAAKYRLQGERFLMHGFSGGGHFAHRFFYLHPDRLAGVSIGAPGTVTLLDPKQDWWCGVRNIEAEFGQAIDYEALRRVPVQTVIGAEDKETWEITITKDSQFWMEGANDAGRDRLERLDSLRKSLEANGIAVQPSVVPGVAHKGFQLLDEVRRFFGECLSTGKTVAVRSSRGAA